MSGRDISLTSQDKLKLESWGLPKLILQKYAEKGITSMFPWQVECLCLPSVLEGGNLVYSAPTSAGKTLVAEILSIQTIIERKKKVFFILPFVSVVREKMLYFKDLLKSSGVRVHGFMGSHSPPGGIAASNLAVCTIEKANGLINRLIEENELDDVGCVVVDELHLLGDPHRGYLLELLLAKLRYVSRKEVSVKIQVVGMSATLPNLKLLANWLDAALYCTDFRPVPLTEYLKVESTIYRASDMNSTSMTLPNFDIKDDPGDLITLCLDAILSGHSALVFCPSKNWCETLAQQIAAEICKMGCGNTPLGIQLREQLNTAAISDCLVQLKNCPVGLEAGLAKSVSFGVAYHHAGLTMDERDILETSFRQCVLRVLVATSTLSSGVNLPARRVMVRSPLFNGRPIDILTYKQMIGRAGRMGKDTAGESFLICKATEKRLGEALVNSELPSVQSCLGLGDLSSSLKRAVLEVIASGVVTSMSDVEEYTSCTLFAASQNMDESTHLGEPIAACIEFLKANEFIKVMNGDQIVPTSLGEACLSAAMPPDHALRLLAELHRARQCFVLDSELHVIYQVTPFSVSEQWRQLDWMSAFALWEGLSPSMQRVGELVGVEERFLVRAIRGNINTNSVSQMEKLSIFRRFYTALALQDLVNEVPLVTVAAKYKCTKGMLQSLQQSSSTFAGMVTQFCRRLGWSSMELLVSQFGERLQFGVQRELIDLLRIDCISALQARALYNADIHNLTKLASVKVEKVEKALRKAVPFESEKVQNGQESEGAGRKRVWLAGRAGVTDREAALLIIKEAREFLQAELGLETAKWADENSIVTEALEDNLSNLNDVNDTKADNDSPQSPEGSLTQFTMGDALEQPENLQENTGLVSVRHPATVNAYEIVLNSDAMILKNITDIENPVTEMKTVHKSNVCVINEKDTFESLTSENENENLRNENEDVGDESDATDNAKLHRNSIDLFESSFDSTGSFNLEYTATPEKLSEHIATNNIEENKDSENDCNQNHFRIKEKEHTVFVEDEDKFDASNNFKLVELHENILNTEMIPNSESVFLNDSIFQLENFNLTKIIQEKTSNSSFQNANSGQKENDLQNIPNTSFLEDLKLIPPRGEGVYTADTVIISGTDETRMLKVSSQLMDKSCDEIHIDYKVCDSFKMSTPKSTNDETSSIDMFEFSPTCDNLDVLNTALSRNSLDNMDCNWGGGSLLENSMFLLAVAETTKRKLSMSEIDSSKRKKIKTCDKSLVTEGNKHISMNGICANGVVNKIVDSSNNNLLGSVDKLSCNRSLQLKDSPLFRNVTAFSESLDINTQLFKEFDNLNDIKPIEINKKVNPFNKNFTKVGQHEINDNKPKRKTLNLEDEDMVIGTPIETSVILNRSCSFTKTISKDIDKEDKSMHQVEDEDIIVGTPIEKSDIFTTSFSSVTNISNCNKKEETDIRSTEVLSVKEDFNNMKMQKLSCKNNVGKNIKNDLSLVSKLMYPPKQEIIKRCVNLTHENKILNRADAHSNVNIPLFKSKTEIKENTFVINKVSESVLEVAAGLQSICDFDETIKTNGNMNREEKPLQGDHTTTTKIKHSHSNETDKKITAPQVENNINENRLIVDIDDFVYDSQEDFLTSSRSVCTRSKTKISSNCKMSASSSSSSSSSSCRPKLPVGTQAMPSQGTKFNSPEDKKSQSLVVKRFQSPVQPVTVKDVCIEPHEIEKLKDALKKKKVVAVGLHVVKQGEKRSEGIGARILGQRSLNCDSEGAFSSRSSIICGMAVYWGGSSLYYLDLTKSNCPCVPIVRDLFTRSSVTLIMYNLKNQMKLFHECTKMDFNCQGSDPIIADWMFAPHGRSRSLAQLVKSNNVKCPPHNDSRPVAGDVIRVWQLHGHMEKKLKQAELLPSYTTVEMPIQFTLCRMEMAGFGFDHDYAELLWARVEIKMSELQELAFQFAGRKFNPRSKADLNKVLQAMTNNSCSDDEQESISQIVKKWRKLNTLKTKCLSPLLLENVSRLFGVCITCTQTGRVSMHEPNLQNTPKDMVIDDEVFSLRTAFVPSPGFVLVSSDYCQLELRLLAHLSQDPVLLDAFGACSDIFISIAASWHNISEAHVTDELRHHTKQICYGLIYGMGVASLAEQMEVSENEARDMMQSFKDAYPTLQSYLSNVITQCEATKQVRTVLNRVRYLPDIVSKNPTVKSQAERQAVNTTVQGSAADIAKLGMLKVETKLREHCSGSNLVLQLHDELIYEVPVEHLEKAVEIIRTEMESAKQLSVPLPVKTKVGLSWGQLELHRPGL